MDDEAERRQRERAMSLPLDNQPLPVGLAVREHKIEVLDLTAGTFSADGSSLENAVGRATVTSPTSSHVPPTGRRQPRLGGQP